jgi:hypothetical protein
MSFLVGLDLNDVQVQTDSGNASTTGFTLDVASTTNAVAAYISGVRQLAGTDYSVSGTTITFTTAPPTGTNNIMYVYTKAAIINTPADNSVTGSKLDVSLVAGDVVYGSGTDTLARLAKGSDGEFLKLASGIPSWAAVAGADIQEFTSSGTWTKPSSGGTVIVECWGGGASGGTGGDATSQGGPGGGGAYIQVVIDITALGSTETVTIGAGGVSVSADSTVGNVGGSTTFGAFATAYGGGGGGFYNNGGGGGGGGSTGAGNPGGNSSAGAGGGGGGAAGSGSAGGSGGFAAGGGGGDGPDNVGGASFWGGGGGGGSDNADSGIGGTSVLGGGGGGGAGASGNNSAGGVSTLGGNGGLGAVAGGNATAGAAPSGGGGAASNGNSGAGGAGQCRVTTV